MTVNRITEGLQDCRRPSVRRFGGVGRPAPSAEIRAQRGDPRPARRPAPSAVIRAERRSRAAFQPRTTDHRAEPKRNGPDRFFQSELLRMLS
jgi:hypothetical protein